MQFINLYLPEFRPKREWVTLQQSALGFVVFIFAMTAFHFQQNKAAQVATAKTAAMQQDEMEKKKRVDELKHKTRVSDKAHLQAQVEEMRQSITNRQAIMKVIASNDLGNKTGFSQNLFSLGQEHLDDIVVNKLVLTKGAKYVELEGITRSPSSVPLYVHKLQQSTAFAGSKFGALSIRQQGKSAHFQLGGDVEMAADTVPLVTGSGIN